MSYLSQEGKRGTRESNAFDRANAARQQPSGRTLTEARGHTHKTIVGSPSIKKAASLRQRLFINKSWRCPTLTWGDPTLPSALSVFTSEFEKGSGGTHSLWPPEIRLEFESRPRAAPTYFSNPRIKNNLDSDVLVSHYMSHTTPMPKFVANFDALRAFAKVLWCYMIKPHVQLVLVSFTHYCASTPSLSTS